MLQICTQQIVHAQSWRPPSLVCSFVSRADQKCEKGIVKTQQIEDDETVWKVKKMGVEKKHNPTTNKKQMSVEITIEKPLAFQAEKKSKMLTLVFFGGSWFFSYFSGSKI